MFKESELPPGSSVESHKEDGEVMWFNITLENGRSLGGRLVDDGYDICIGGTLRERRLDFGTLGTQDTRRIVRWLAWGLVREGR